MKDLFFSSDFESCILSDRLYFVDLEVCVTNTGLFQIQLLLQNDPAQWSSENNDIHWVIKATEDGTLRMDDMGAENDVGFSKWRVVGWGMFSLFNSFKNMFFFWSVWFFSKKYKEHISFSINIYQNGKKILQLLL